MPQLRITDDLAERVLAHAAEGTSLSRAASDLLEQALEAAATPPAASQAVTVRRPTRRSLW